MSTTDAAMSTPPAWIWCYAEGVGVNEIMKPSPIPEAVREALSDDRQVYVRLVSF